MPEFVRVTNVNNIPFDFHQNNQKRIVAPGGDVIIPWHLAMALFGNPGLGNRAPEFARQKQYDKIRGLYGFANGLSTEEEWEDRKPRITVTDLETNEQIVMLMDDPDGQQLHNAPAQSTAPSDVEALQRQIASLQAQMQTFLNAATGPQAAAAGTPSSPTATSDAPPPVAPPADPQRNPAFDVVAAPIPASIPVNAQGEPVPAGQPDVWPEDDSADITLEELGITIEAPIADASDDSPQAVSTGDDPGKATTTRRRASK